MSSNYSSEYKDRGAHRFHARHRAVKKLSTLSLVLGILCLLISGITLCVSFFGTAVMRHKFLVMTLCYLGVGLVLLAVRWGLEIFRNRVPSKHGRTHYHPRLDSDSIPPRQALPLNGKSAAVPAGEKDGAALVLVLILLALIAGLVTETQIAARISLRHQQTRLLQARLQNAAADAAWHALRKLADDEDLAVDHTNEAWSATEEVTDPAGIATRVKVTDRDGRFDLNNLAIQPPPSGARPAGDIAMDIMTLCGDFAPADRIAPLADWVDSNDEGFAEKSRYMQQEPPYGAANRPLYALSEILWVQGFDRAYFDRHERHSPVEMFNADVVDCLDALPGLQASATPINVNTANKEVLLGVLGMAQESMVQLIRTQRSESPIRSVDRLYGQIGQTVPEPLRPYLGTRSRFFAVDAQAHAEGRTERLRVLAQRDSSGNVEVLQWVF